MNTTFDTMALTLLLPLLGALIIGTTGKRWGKDASGIIASGAVGLSFLVVLGNLVNYYRAVSGLAITGATAYNVKLWDWANLSGPSGDLNISFGLYIDALSLCLMTVITGVGFLIHWFSIEYMKKDPDVSRYFCLLNLFIAAMTMLVLANNFAVLIIGWGGVGFASFALIGFWRDKPSAAAASKKAFVMNVIGDIGLMVAVFVLYSRLNSLDFQTVLQEKAPALVGNVAAQAWLPILLIGLLIGAYAKSAQLPLHTWLPDAMEGPTPVSALIHAATMVTAGVYLLVRCHPLFELSPNIMFVVACLGAATALFAACCALVQNDLKRVLAYSTMSQLGYMFLAVGLGAYGAAIFHLVTHAFFKALLFLTAGIVIHTAHGEQDMRRLGGLSKDIPYTAFMFGVGGAALAGVPLTAGFFSKEAILHAAHHHHAGTILFLVGAVVAVMTAFYTGRAFFMTFWGPQRIEEPHLPGAHTVMSCTVLTLLALGAGYFYHDFSEFLSTTSSNKEGFHIEPGVLTGPAVALSVLVVVALAVAFSLYGKGQADRLGQNTTFLTFVRNGFGVDNTFEVWSGGVSLTGRLTNRGVDQQLSLHLPRLLAQSFQTIGNTLRQTQTGQIRHYMLSIMASLIYFIFFLLFLNQGGSGL